MNHWLGIALIAYSIGALIEGIHASNQLIDSLSKTANGAEHPVKHATEPQEPFWHMFTAIVTVSICGAFFWPFRLVHGLIKKGQPQPPG
jgi:hypothetical protein